MAWNDTVGSLSSDLKSPFKCQILFSPHFNLKDSLFLKSYFFFSVRKLLYRVFSFINSSFNVLVLFNDLV